MINGWKVLPSAPEDIIHSGVVMIRYHYLLIGAGIIAVCLSMAMLNRYNKRLDSLVE